MAKNDKILIDGIVDDRVANSLPSNKRDEAFEYLAFEQILKDFDLSKDDLEGGTVDGRQDGGIDGLYIFVNGHILQDVEAFLWPKTGAEMSVHIFTCKHHDTFKQSVLDALIASITELLDFEIEDRDLKGAYSPALIRFRNNLKYAYRKLSPKLSDFSISTYYVSRGDASEIGAEVRARANQISALVGSLFGQCTSKFDFVGCAELVALHRKINSYTLELPYVEVLSRGERYVLLAKLDDYFAFISDGGKLRRYLFESNVRDFMGLNRVNDDIRRTLEDAGAPDFWLLNNGVTILATAASLVGKAIQIQDIQIVNGLQTTESIYRFMAAGGVDSAGRSVLVKVIVTRDEAVRDAIIRATNNQTSVELASLHATDKIQRDIEDIMQRSGLCYERRKNYYVNLGHSQTEIITPQYVAAGYIGLVLKSPLTASTIRSKFMRSEDAYGKVFSDAIPLKVWPVIAKLLKRVDAGLEVLRPKGSGTDKFLKKWRYLVALLIVSKTFGKFSFSASELVDINVDDIGNQSIRNIWDVVHGYAKSESISLGLNSRSSIERICECYAREHNIKDFASITGRPAPFTESQLTITKEIPTAELIERVFSVLPPQPWKVGSHREVLAKMNCSKALFSASIDALVDDGRIFRQRNGVLYDRDGSVVGFDAERVDPQSLRLREDRV